MALNLKVLQVLHLAALLFVLLPQALILLLKLHPTVGPSVAFFDPFDLACELLNPLVGLPDLFLLLGKLSRESLFFREARHGLHFEVSCAQEGEAL